jgi:hypothetical protein
MLDLVSLSDEIEFKESIIGSCEVSQSRHQQRIRTSVSLR